MLFSVQCLSEVFMVFKEVNRIFLSYKSKLGLNYQIVVFVSEKYEDVVDYRDNFVVYCGESFVMCLGLEF